jgi:hypothetical protein
MGAMGQHEPSILLTPSEWFPKTTVLDLLRSENVLYRQGENLPKNMPLREDPF